MIKFLKKIKSAVLSFYYLKLSFLSNNIKKKSFYKFVRDGYADLLFKELFLNNNSIVFDVGGYQGEFSDRIQKICDCNIYIFEPVKEYYDMIILKQKNNLKVHCFNFGLGAKIADVEIVKSGFTSSIYSAKVGSSVQIEKIKIEPIIKFINDKKMEIIDLIKINIEGSEYDLLDSLIAHQHSAKKVKIFLIQFHDFVSDSIGRRRLIQSKLSLTHKKVFDYPFIWEKWTLK